MPRKASRRLASSLPAAPNAAQAGVLRIQVDGAARGNPGPAGIGAVFFQATGQRCGELSVALGEATNNVAETCALILSLQEALKRGARRVAVETDSELLARQVTGAYRVRDRQLQWLHVFVRQLISGFARFEIRHIPRSENRPADRLANRAVNALLSRSCYNQNWRGDRAVAPHLLSMWDRFQTGRNSTGYNPVLLWTIGAGRKVRTPKGSGVGNAHPPQGEDLRHKDWRTRQRCVAGEPQRRVTVASQRSEQ